MIRSMTAFSRQQSSGELGDLVLEIRSVNHRYLDISLRLPEGLRSLEGVMRESMIERLGRGKVECSLRHQSPQLSGAALDIDEARVKQIAQVSRQIDAILYNPSPISSLEVLGWPGVLKTQTLDLQQMQTEVLAVLALALDDLIATREREGEKLAAVIEQRCAAMAEIVVQVNEKMPQILTQWREKLNSRLQQASLEVDADRLEQEMVYLAQKTDVAEEMDRLQMHLEEVRRVLAEDQPVGRRLDFLMQELNREANTLGSKSVDADTTRASVDLKVFIEQIREQVQNIE